jgi:hypothetical protein
MNIKLLMAPVFLAVQHYLTVFCAKGLRFPCVPHAMWVFTYGQANVIPHLVSQLAENNSFATTNKPLDIHNAETVQPTTVPSAQLFSIQAVSITNMKHVYNAKMDSTFRTSHLWQVFITFVCAMV